jgi:hypothetical protein
MPSAVICYINYLVALRPNIIRPDCAFPIQWWILCSSITTTPLLAAILMVCEHTTDYVCCTPGLIWAKIYSRDVSPTTRAIPRGLGVLTLVELCPAHLRLDLLKGYVLT